MKPIDDFDTAISLIEEHPDEVDFEGQPETRIDRAEQALGVRFPPSYRRFLREFGAGSIGPEEIYGLVSDDFADSRPPHAVGLTLELRRDGQISEKMVVIYNLGQGSYYALDLKRTGADGEAPVVGFTPGLSPSPRDFEVIAPNFGRFFLDIARATLIK